MKGRVDQGRSPVAARFDQGMGTRADRRCWTSSPLGTEDGLAEHVTGRRPGRPDRRPGPGRPRQARAAGRTAGGHRRQGRRGGRKLGCRRRQAGDTTTSWAGGPPIAALDDKIGDTDTRIGAAHQRISAMDEQVGVTDTKRGSSSRPARSTTRPAPPTPSWRAATPGSAPWTPGCNADTARRPVRPGDDRQPLGAVDTSSPPSIPAFPW